MPHRIAIIGAGPAGFFLADKLLSQEAIPVQVDQFERLPSPYGLVRFGVAADHEKIKNVTRQFDKIAARPGFRFFGNVEIGRQLTLDDLRRHYHQIAFATGAQTDRHMGIPGEDLVRSHPATEFVAWYNAHPDFRDRTFDLSVKRVAVVGVGNVAVDVARMLTLTHEELEGTDTADYAIEALAGSGVREIVILGRRGPQQAAFTLPELLELGELTDADIVVDSDDLQIEQELHNDSLEGPAKRNMETLHSYAAREPGGKRRRVVLRFLTSPVEILGDGKVEAVRVARNRLVHDDEGRLRAVSTDVEEVLEAGLVFRAIGYTGVPLPGLPFDERRGVIPNVAGRVLDASRTYVSGWIKRGPSGVIGTNKKCATDTVNTLLDDLAAGALHADDPAHPRAIWDELTARRPDLVTYEGWERIDEAERAAGGALGRPRVKFTTVEELLQAARERSGA